MALLTRHTNKHFLRHRTGQEDIRRKELKQGKADRWTDEPKCDSVTAASCEWGGFFRTAAGLPGYDQGPCFGRALSNRLEGQGWSQTGRMSYSHCNKQSATFFFKMQRQGEAPGPCLCLMTHQTLTDCLERGFGRHSPWPRPPPYRRPSLRIQIPEEPSFVA